jgi:phosphatidate cytidylyltransferase
MSLNLPTFYKRTASAIVFAIIMLTGLLWNEWAFLGLICIIELACFNEYISLMKKIHPEAHWPNGLVISFMCLGALITVIMALIINASHNNGAATWLIAASGYSSMLLPLAAIIPAIFFIAALLSHKEFLTSFLLAMLGILYITLPMACLLYMYHVNFVLPLALILMIWTNDTMAYLVGAFIGKTPFSPISPNKTWEGTIGGALLTVIGSGVYAYFRGNHMIDFMALAFCAAIAGTLGDLIESKLKRLADVKDSGAIMPGHGGAMDRFDSLLIATPFAFAYVACFVHSW